MEIKFSKRTLKNALAILLSFMMIISSVSIAFAVPSERNYTNNISNGNVTDGNKTPTVTIDQAKDTDGDGFYEIDTVGKLYWFAEWVKNPNLKDVELNAELTADIVVNENVLVDGKLNPDKTVVSNFVKWKPIGEYTGTFDGQGHTISGLYLDGTTGSNMGLFESSKGRIKNVGVVDSYNSYISDDSYGTHSFACGICVFNHGTIENSYNAGTVNGSGICEFNYGTITNCYNVGNASYNGICGKNYQGTIENCYNTDDISGSGICGKNEGKIIDCYNTGNVSGYSYVGGICGDSTYGTITNCYNKGDVSGKDFVGGICGRNSGTITNCYNTGIVTGKNYVGGISGKSFDKIELCYNTGNVIGENYIGGICGIGDAKECYNMGAVSCKSNHDSNIYIGGICGQSRGITSNCYNTGAIYGALTNKSLYIGGICGYNGSSNCTVGIIENCYNTSSISCELTNKSAYVGGICGFNGEKYGVIKNCYSTGDVIGTNYVGGICGVNINGKSTISNCYNTGTINGKDCVGGICGKNFELINNCYNTGDVSGTNYVGGICGQDFSIVTSCYNTGNIIANCYDTYIGGICGKNGDDRFFGKLTNCYYLDNNVWSDCGIILTFMEMKQKDSYVGFDFENIWEFKENSEYPFPTLKFCPVKKDNLKNVSMLNLPYTLKYEINKDNLCLDGGYLNLEFDNGINYPIEITNDMVTGFNNTQLGAQTLNISYQNYTFNFDIEIVDTKNPDFAGGIGTRINPYLVSNEVELQNIGKYPDANFILINDIVLNENVLISGKLNADPIIVASFKQWIPIEEFRGILDGQGHTINGMFINGNNTGNLGLIGVLKGIVKNIGFVDGYINGGHHSGMICGKNYNGRITNCYNTGNVSRENGYDISVGGICGENNGTISSCFNTGNVSCNDNNDNAGGICGDNYGTITNCYNTGAVSGSNNVGGICGYNDNSTITNCYNTGAVSGESINSSVDVGGICGYNYNGRIINCYNTGAVSGSDNIGGICGDNYGTITNCYNTGAVSGSSNVGGICGYNDNGTITNCYNIGASSGGGICGENVNYGTITNCYYLDNVNKSDGGTKCTEEQMIEQSTYYGFDFDKVWMIDATSSYKYPQLKNNLHGATIIKSIEIEKLPNKLTYKETDVFDATGGKIKVVYEDGKVISIPISNDMVTGFDNTKIGKQTLTVTYREFTATVEIEIISNKIIAIGMNKLPNKTNYDIGTESLDLTGGEIIAIYEDGTSKVIPLTDTVASGYNPKKVGEQNIKVTYKGEITFFKINVKDSSILAISIDTLPTKLNYFIGDSIDITGGIISVYKSDGTVSKINMTKDMISGFDSSYSGTQSVGVVYKGQGTTFDITVRMLGDVDSDETISANDYAIVVAYANGTGTLTDEQKMSADVNRDGAVDGFDVIRIDLYRNGYVKI